MKKITALILIVLFSFSFSQNTSRTDAIDNRVTPASVGVSVTLSDATELTITDANKNPGFTGSEYCRGFHTNDTGSLAMVLAGSTDTLTIFLNKGAYYPYSVKKFMSTGSTINDGEITAFR